MANGSAAKAIVIAGLMCGVLDITAALLVYGYLGLKPLPLLQGIAGGVLGPRAFDGGLTTALLGLFLHFVIAFGAARILPDKPQSEVFGAARRFIRGAVRGSGVFLHAGVCCPIVGSKEASFFTSNDDHWGGHPCFLRGFAHLAECPALRGMIWFATNADRWSGYMEGGAARAA